MFADIITSEPIEKISGDWDFLNDKVLSKFSTFRVVGENVYGIRRRYVEGDSGVVDVKKGAMGRHYEIGPSGIVENVKKPFQIYVTTGGTPHHVEHNFGYWHINDMDELYLRFPGETPDVLGYSIVIQGAIASPGIASNALLCFSRESVRPVGGDLTPSGKPNGKP